MEWSAAHGAAVSPADWTGQQVRIRLRDLARAPELAAIGIHSAPRGMQADDVLIEGRFLNLHLRPGLHLHVSDMEERHAMPTRTVQAPGLYCIFLLRGMLDLHFGARAFRVGRGPAGQIRGFSVIHTRPAEFERIPPGPQRVQKVVISATPEWLASHARDLGEGVCNWQVSETLAGLLGQVIRPRPVTPGLNRLYFESRTIDIIAQSLATMWDGDRPGVSARGRQSLDRARAFIRTAGPEPLSVARIARAAGASATVLQRLFRLEEGVGIAEYVRNHRLDHARAALARGEDISSVAHAAGYATPGNFATAFRRRFGVSPRNIRHRDGAF
ncbi:helix-turn-helix transcriptional regulator [Paenirhodobacter sp.]|uniref:helix-turn-helix transcriptional regulator n=1 Tax=Paenirhodobacter sp. TaxID=1965326 RepID=UPI003B41A1EE